MINTIDLFAGCGGITEGFLQTGDYNTLAAIEWEKWPVETLKHRLKTKYNYTNVEDVILRYDIQKVDSLIKGWNDEEYGSFKGLDLLIKEQGKSLDVIIGGPPCQAYSIAGRIRDKDGMKYDYRNYLFESYMEIVKHYKPRLFVFENVPGILSARPGEGEELIINDIQNKIEETGYHIMNDLKDAVIDFTQYGIPQNRKRVIIVGLNKDVYGDEAEVLLNDFYNKTLPKYKESLKTVKDAIGDLTKLYPLKNCDDSIKSREVYTLCNDNNIKNHKSRFHNERDIRIFNLLAEDIESGRNKYITTDSLKELYFEVTGRKSNVHKYNVLRWDKPSNTIPAHLYKDGLRHIHPDSKQSRSITVREAARLQTFPDDFEFISQTNQDYKMIGNAVPPKFSKKLALAIKEDFFK